MKFGSQEPKKVDVNDYPLTKLGTMTVNILACVFVVREGGPYIPSALVVTRSQICCSSAG